MKNLNLIAAALLLLGIQFATVESADAGVANPTVTSGAQLLAALKTAQGGNIIRLAPGTYSNVTIVNANFSTPVTITSSTASHPALMSGLRVANSSGLIFKNLELTSVGSPDGYYAFRIAGSKNITFAYDDIHGDVNGVPGDQLMGFYVSACSSIAFQYSTFHHINLAILAGTSSGITITNNQFSYLNKSGIQMAAVQDVVIQNNQFTNFILTPNTHPDAIQLFTAGTKVQSTNITISGNIYYRGVGQAAQGIFIRDETGVLPYHGLRVSNNAMIGGMWNAIYLDNVGSDTHVTNNYVASWPDSTTAFKSWIYMTGDAANQSGVLQGNHAQQYIVSGKSTVPSGNYLVNSISDKGMTQVQAWQSSGNQLMSAIAPSP